MSINNLIIDTLEPLNIPVNFQTYEGTEETYITFFTYLEQGESFADDEEKTTGHYIQVDVWSKGNYNKLVKQVKELLKQVGFKRKYEIELYESDTKIYHKCIRFFYTENCGNKEE